MSDIIIPKKRISSFLLGVGAALLLLFILGSAYAASVFNANGGTITNIGTPTANSDAATKGYVDAAGGSGYINWSDCEYDHQRSTSRTYVYATCSAGYVMVAFTCLQNGGICDIVGANKTVVHEAYASTNIKCCKYID